MNVSGPTSMVVLSDRLTRIWAVVLSSVFSIEWGIPSEIKALLQATDQRRANKFKN